MSPIPNRASDAGPEPRQDPDKPIPSEDAIVERLTKYLAEWGYTSDEVRDFSGTDWENHLFSLNLLKYGYTEAMCVRVVARLLQAEIEDRAKDLDWQRRTAEAAELREEQEWDAAQMNETGAMRCPPKE